MTHRPLVRLAPLLLVVAQACAPHVAGSATAPLSLIDDVNAAEARLRSERASLLDAVAMRANARVLNRMVDLGMWGAVDSIADQRGSDGFAEPLARLAVARHRYEVADSIVREMLRLEPAHRGARLLDGRLRIQAWELPRAIAIAEAMLAEDPSDAEAAALIGRVHLLEKRYDDALEWARRVQQLAPDSPDGYLLEADVRFWDQDPAGAESFLVEALRRDPFDPDARFSYGYAIWRRVDATQLDAMAAQWNLALDIDPLHYITHWHWGNGHTNLTYADYAQPEDSVVRALLAPADSLISAGRIAEALDVARKVEAEHPTSVLPAMLRGSTFYMAWAMDRAAQLDSAQAAFQDVLTRKPNYGPAHNGLAAVIKQRQIGFLAAYDSLAAVIDAVDLPAGGSLEAVFPDVRYYPGDRVAKMTVLELGPSIAYLPLIERQGRVYRIPPLHHDLAQAMGQSFFRTSTTFDNRQWMDIRGVGSGAAAIEYVERGAHQERKVLLHEFVHLFHGIVFTDAEARAVRDLYHRAMAEDRTLDYYASNNESEFLAQVYPAYFSPVKVHPLNHKSMNTIDDLRARDPATFAWIEALVDRQRRYLEGDTAALASNWAQVYVNLSRTARREDDGFDRALALLDTAMVWDSAYVPAMLSRAQLLWDAGRFADAETWIDRAAAADPRYAPVLVARADLLEARERAAGSYGAVDERAALLRRAMAIETDLAERAMLNRRLRELYASHARLPEALEVAREYAASGPRISTYLRDRVDEAAAFAWEVETRMGITDAAIAALGELVARKPQAYTHRAQLADALLRAGEDARALRVLEEAQRILRAAGAPNAGFAARIAEIHIAGGDTTEARAALEGITPGRGTADAALRLARVHASLGASQTAEEWLAAAPEATTPAALAELALTRGALADMRGDREEAERQYREAARRDPYLLIGDGAG